MGRAEKRKVRRMIRTGKVAQGWEPAAPGRTGAAPQVEPPRVEVGWLPELGERDAGGLGGAAPPVSAAAKDVPATAKGTAADDHDGGPAPLPPHQQATSARADELGGTDVLPAEVAPDAEQALGLLRAALDARQQAVRGEASALRACRDAGVSWSRLGEEYGLTRSGVQHRYRALERLVPEGRSSSL